MNLFQRLLSLGKRARSGIKWNQPVTMIVIHWIGPYIQRVTTVRDWWESGSDGDGVQASAHFVVKDNDVLQALPLDEVGWHSGDGRNYYAIGIEVCPASVGGEFSQASIDSLRELIAYIRQIHPQAKQIVRHYDGVQKKDCPRYYTPIVSLLDGGGRVDNPVGGDQRWDALREYIDGK